MTLGQRLRLIRENKKISRGELAEACGGSYSAIKNYELDLRQPDIETAKALAVRLGVSLDFLVKGTEERNTGSDSLPTADTLQVPRQRLYPILGRVAAGYPIFAEQNIEGYSYGDSMEDGEYFYLRVSGDSMTGSRIYDGDLVFVKSQSTVENGAIAVVMLHKSEATLKTFRQTEEGVWLMPSNPAYVPIFVSRQEMEKDPECLTVVGEVKRVVIDLTAKKTFG